MLNTKQMNGAAFLRTLRTKTLVGSVVSHRDMVAVVEEETERRGWLLGKNRSHLSTDGSCMASSWDVAVPSSDSEYHIAESLVPSLGIVNCNRSPFTRKFYGGFRFTDDDSGIVMMEHAMGRIAGDPLKLKEAMGEAFEEYEVGMVQKGIDPAPFDANVVILQERNLSQEDEAMLVYKAGQGYLNRMTSVQQCMMPWSHLGVVATLYQRGPRTAWNFLRCFASMAKRNEPIKQFEHLFKFFKLLHDPSLASVRI